MYGGNSGVGPLLAAALLLALAACRDAPSYDAPADGNLTEPEATSGPPPPDADINASLGELGAAPPPPGEGGEPPRFVGRWAADEGMCAQSAWVFTADELRTPAGSVCRFTNVREVPGGYDIEARCSAEAPERDDRLELRFAQSARALLFAADSIADAGLVRCGS